MGKWVKTFQNILQDLLWINKYISKISVFILFSLNIFQSDVITVQIQNFLPRLYKISLPLLFSHTSFAFSLFLRQFCSEGTSALLVGCWNSQVAKLHVCLKYIQWWSLAIYPADKYAGIFTSGRLVAKDWNSFLRSKHIVFLTKCS